MTGISNSEPPLSALQSLSLSSVAELPNGTTTTTTTTNSERVGRQIGSAATEGPVEGHGTAEPAVGESKSSPSSETGPDPPKVEADPSVPVTSPEGQAPFALSANIQARIQAFQNSRRSRSNSGSQGMGSPPVGPASLSLAGLSRYAPSNIHSPPQGPQSTTSSPSLSPTGELLEGNSLAGTLAPASAPASSAANALPVPVRGTPSGSSPGVMAAGVPGVPGVSGAFPPSRSAPGSATGSSVTTPGASFSGPLAVSPALGAQSLQAKKPSLSMRRGNAKLNTSGLTLSNMSPASGPQPVPGPNGVARRRPSNRDDGQPTSGNGGVSAASIAAAAALRANGSPSAGPSIFDNYKKYVDIKSGSLNFNGKASLHSKGIDFSSGTSFRISLDEFDPLGELGRGNYGTVTKVLHKPTNVIMAMKEIRLELDEQKLTQIIMELDILHRCASSNIVDFFGAFFVEGAVYLCMEYMDGGSLDKIYDGGVAEPYLAVITRAVVEGLKQLKDSHNIIHRDVKPTNILVSTQGKIKLCDFGVSGNLVASIAKTNIGCQSYMAPERIKSTSPNDAITYTVHSDIWSLGLSILETAKGLYPYPPETYNNIFSQLSAIVDGVPPQLPADTFSPEARDFVDQCLNKVPRLRPTYAKLLAHPWLNKYREEDVDLAGFVKEAKAKRAASSRVGQTVPALHHGVRTQAA